MLGGLGILAGLLLAFGLCFPSPDRLWGWLAGMLMVFGLGLLDDWRNVSPFIKLVTQFGAAGVALRDGLAIPGLPTALAMPLTLLWIVAVTNAFNLLDNMDGLAAGTAVIAAFALFIQAAIVPEAIAAIPCLAVAGSALGFLFLNRHPARVFMGDCGSMALGFSLATLAMHSTASLAPNLAVALMFPCFVLAVPLFDTCFVSLMRMRNGRSIAVGGRDHTSHRLVFLGFPEGRAVEVLWACSVAMATLGLVGLNASSLGMGVATLVAAAGLVGVGVYLGRVEVYGSTPWRSEHSRALIVGTGQEGARALQAIRADRGLRLRPVGFIEANGGSNQRTIGGVRVLGTRATLARLIAQNQVSELILATASLGSEAVEELVAFCKENGLAYREYRETLSEARNAH